MYSCEYFKPLSTGSGGCWPAVGVACGSSVAAGVEATGVAPVGEVVIASRGI